MKSLVAIIIGALSAAAIPAAAQTPPAPTQPAATQTATPQASAPATPPNRYEVIARAIVDNFNAGRFDAVGKDFNDSMRKAVTPATLKSVHDEVRTAAGAFKSITSVEMKLSGFPTIDILAAYEKAPVSIQVVFDRSGRVGAVYFHPLIEEKVDPALEQLGRELLANMAAGRYEDAASHFDAALREQMPPKTLADLAAKLRSSFGPFQSVKNVRQKTLPEKTTLYFATMFEFAPVKATVVFNAKEKRVIGFGFQPANAVTSTIGR